jgi:beta-glucosidase
MTLEEKFWQLFMIPGDLDDSTLVYSLGAFGLQINSGIADTARAKLTPGEAARHDTARTAAPANRERRRESARP